MGNKEFFGEMEQSIVNYDKDEAVRLAKMALQKGVEPAAAIEQGFVKGIQVV